MNRNEQRKVPLKGNSAPKVTANLKPAALQTAIEDACREADLNRLDDDRLYERN